MWKKNSKRKAQPFILITSGNVLMQGKRNISAANGKGPFSKLNCSLGKKVPQNNNYPLALK